MKYIALLLTIFSGFAYAQTDIEEQSEDSFVSADSSKNLMTYDVKGIFQLADKKCLSTDGHQFSSIKFEKGEADFTQNLKAKINQVLNMDAYAANGPFYIDLSINRSGNITDITPGPGVPNTRYFYEDLRSAVKKIKSKLTPATCDGSAIESKIRIKLLFDSLSIDNN